MFNQFTFFFLPFTAREISKLGDLLDMDVCMEILDILYETEDTSLLFNSPCSLAASTLVCMLYSGGAYSGKSWTPSQFLTESCFNPFQVAAYVISVPKQTWEFPILPWGKQLLEHSSLFMYNLIFFLSGRKRTAH